MKNLTFALSLAALSLTLAGCEKTKEQFDFSKKAPDEFAVTKRAPLEMPPDYTLRPPRPGAQRPQELRTDEQAKQAVFGEETLQPKKREQQVLTEGEAILLQKTGAYDTNPDIRRVVDEETAVLAEEETPTIDRIMKVTGKKIEAPASTVDPVAETERIKQNKEEGKPINEGETPTNEE